MTKDIEKLAPELLSPSPASPTAPSPKTENLPKVSVEVKSKMQAERKRLGLKWDDYLERMVGVATQRAPVEDNLPGGLRPDLSVGGGVSIPPLLLSQETKEEFVKEYYELLRDTIGLRRKKVQAEVEEEFGEEGEGGNMSSKIIDKVMEMQALDKLVEGMNKNKEGDKKMDTSDMMLMMMMMNQQKAPPQQPQTMDPMMMMMFMQSMQKEPPKDDKMSNLLVQYMQNEVAGQREANKQLLADMMQQRREEKITSDQKALLEGQASIFQAFKDEVAQQFGNFTQGQQQQLDYLKQQNDMDASLRKTLSIIDSIKEFEEHARDLGISKGLSSEASQKAVAEATSGKNDLLMNLITKGLEYITSQTKQPVPVPGGGGSVPPVTTPPPKPAPKPVEIKPPKPINFIEPTKE